MPPSVDRLNIATPPTPSPRVCGWLASRSANETCVEDHGSDDTKRVGCEIARIEAAAKYQSAEARRTQGHENRRV